MIESQLEQLLRREIKRRGGRVDKLIATHAGIPDDLVLMPGGRVYLVELKTETGRLSPIQELWHAHASELGTDVVVLYGRMELLRWVWSL